MCRCIYNQLFIICLTEEIAEEPTSITSSSTRQDQEAEFGPQNAIDSHWANDRYNDYKSFASKTESMPWIQWRLPNRTNIMGLVVSMPHADGPYDLGASNFKNVEIRAGLEKIDSKARGPLTANTVCGKFDGPGVNRRAYLIVCDKNIVADFVSVQLLDNNATLSINELEIIKDIDTGKQ